MTEVYGLNRPTLDLDVVEIAPGKSLDTLLSLAGKGTELSCRFGIYLDFVGVSTLPEDYESRLTEVFVEQCQHLRGIAFEPHDLA